MLQKKQVVYLSLLLFVLCVAYIILRNLKDAAILTAGGSGAEIIPFIKVWGMLPASCLMATFFAFLSRHLSRKGLFYTLSSLFLAYYLLFCFLLFPYKEFFEPQAFGTLLQSHLPYGWRGLAEMIVHWPHTLYYILSELWAIVIVNVLFWGIVNESLSQSESKQHFGTIKFGGTISAFMGGILATFFTCRSLSCYLPGSTLFEQTLVKQTLFVTFLVALSFYLFHKLFPLFQEVQQKEKKKVRLSLLKGLSFVWTSPYLLSIAMCVVGYNIVFNLSDVLWKQTVSKVYQDPNDLMSYMNTITIFVGVFAVISVLLSGTIVKKMGLQTLASLTPIAILLTSVGFFSSFFLGDGGELILVFGAVQSCLTKGLKYSAFDVSKELAFVPLDPDTKWNGKGVIDGIGNDIGKTGAAIVLQGLLYHFGGMGAACLPVAWVIFVVLGLWLVAVRVIGKTYERDFIAVK
jgi:AAA family ATP:ADP antiporter